MVRNVPAPTGAEEHKGHGSDDDSFSDSDDHGEDEDDHGWFLALPLTSCSRRCTVHPLDTPRWLLCPQLCRGFSAVLAGHGDGLPRNTAGDVVVKVPGHGNGVGSALLEPEGAGGADGSGGGRHGKKGGVRQRKQPEGHKAGAKGAKQKGAWPALCLYDRGKHRAF